MGTEAQVAVIGGSGLYRLFDLSQAREVQTPFGDPSAPITIAAIDGRSVAFLPRHGTGHTIPPHAINYRANIQALQMLGVQRVIAPAAVGSLRRDMAPGHIVICDQFIDRTWGRPDSFFGGPQVAHVAMSDPYCRELRPLAASAARAAGLSAHNTGTVVITQGPRFSSRAESRFHRTIGGDVVNMTQYPEVALARELGMCYVNISVVTDYDSGLDEAPDARPVTQDEVLRVFAAGVEPLRDLLVRLVQSLPAERGCVCAAGAATPLHAS